MFNKQVRPKGFNIIQICTPVGWMTPENIHTLNWNTWNTCNTILAWSVAGARETLAW